MSHLEDVASQLAAVSDMAVPAAIHGFADSIDQMHTALEAAGEGYALLVGPSVAVIAQELRDTAAKLETLKGQLLRLAADAAAKA